MNTTAPKNVVPGLSPPPGVVPNFDNPYTLRPAFIVTATLALLLATSAVTVRLVTTFFGQTKKVKVEDCEFFQYWTSDFARLVEV